MKRPTTISMSLTIAAMLMGPAVPAVAAHHPRTGSLTIVAAGDIAGSGSSDDATSNEVIRLNPRAVLTLGDSVYPSGALQQFTKYYAPTWGRFRSITHPVPGNHEYRTAGASGYFGYFGAAAHGPAGYYTYKLGAWRIYALNSSGPRTASSTQVTWLKRQLTAHPSACILAYWHYPRYSSGSTHGGTMSVQPFVDALAAKGADVVLNGHEHNYERFARRNGIRQFVVGTGGAGLYNFRAPVARSRKRIKSFGVLRMRLRPGTYSWSFRSTSNAVLDSGTGTCRKPHVKRWRSAKK